MLGDLEVNDVHRQAAAAPDLDRFLDRLEDAGALGAHVRRIDAAVLARDLASAASVSVSIQTPGGPLNELARPSAPSSMASPTSRRIASSSAGVGWTGTGATNLRPHLARADIRADVRAEARRRSSAKYAVKRGQRCGWRRRSALAEDHRRDALAEHALAVGIVEQRRVGMVVDVDEARRDDEPGRVDGARRRRR